MEGQAPLSLGTHRSNMTVTSMAVRLPLVAAFLWSVVAGILVCDSLLVVWRLGAVFGVAFFVIVLLVMGAMTGIKADPEGTGS